MMRVGVDIVDIIRFEKLIQNERFLEKYFTHYEMGYIRAQERSARSTQSLAGIYAAKEAFLKALGIGIGGGIALNEIEVNHEKSGRPTIKLVTSKSLIILNSMGIENIDVSISHTDEVCMASCLVEGKFKPKVEIKKEEFTETRIETTEDAVDKPSAVEKIVSKNDKK